MPEIKFYNTLTRKKETFKPIKKGEVGIYTCGPTVYLYQHIGNIRAYIFADTLKRVFLYNNYKVRHVINITDVGHLTSDADEGEDKIEKAAKKEGKKADEIARFYFAAFHKDIGKLNILEPDVWCKATEHIKEQIELIKRLEEKGYTYKTSDGIYFDSSKFKSYGKMAKIKVEKLKAGARVEMGEKKHPTDFALWKFSETPGLRQQEWNPKDFGADFPIGFPGWHIECSAMSMKYLGEHFDIHTGGEDHIQVHHTNEIAQAEAVTEKKFVNYWLHLAFLTFKGEKVSKSKGGLYTISELEEQGFKPLSYRYFCLTGHYRTQLNFSLENLKNSENSYERLRNIVAELKDDGKVNKSYIKRFEEAINNDIDTGTALQIMWELLRDEKAQGKLNSIKEMDKVFGLKLLEKQEVEIPSEIQKLVSEREKARVLKNWKKSDELREKIRKKGWQVDDAGDGTRVKRA